jgi:serine/threonine-protein kinase
VAGDGIVHHALRFTMSNGRIRSDAYVHPATHFGFGAGGTSGGPNTLPTGARLRLRGDYPVQSIPTPEGRVVARTLQHYGMYLADGGNIFISATTDNVIGGSIVNMLQPSDFEMVGGGHRIGFHDYSCERTWITN